jgi:penicillin-binding protein 1C
MKAAEDKPVRINGLNKGWRRWLIGVAGTCIVLSGLGVLKVATDYADLPPLPRPTDLSLSAVVLDRNDTLLRAFTSSDEKWRLPVELAEIDPLYVKMLVAYEDKRFYEHDGVDLLAIGRAAGQALVSGRILSGGSTLTMQVSRLLEERPTRSLGDKYRQMLHAIRIDAGLSKDEILSLYMLRAPFGGNLEGVRAASLVWFGKEPKRLTPAEAALLVALPQSPERRRPDRHQNRARQARDRVLDRAVLAGVLSADDAAAAKRDRIPTRRRDMPLLAAHAARDAVAANQKTLVHRLTIDRSLQEKLESLIRSRVESMAPRISAAVVVADHRSGEILSSVGSPGLLQESRLGHMDMTQATRSPGSTLKPLIYGLAFEEGIAHPESFIDDRPIDIGGYRPTNFDLAYQGTVTVREALQLSLNTPAVQLLEAVGPARLVARLKRAGAVPTLDRKKAPGLAIGLGGLGLSLRDLVTLYGALAREGRPVSLAISRDLERPRPSTGHVLEPVAAWHVGDILTGLPQPNSAETAATAYKTGTAYGYRDSWAVGFDGRYVIGVWVGRPDATPVPGATGATAAAPILFEAFQRIGANRYPLPPRPAGALARTTANLPPPLRHARVRKAGPVAAAEGKFRISYPPKGAVVDLGLSGGGSPLPLIVKLEGGARPYSWLVNGAPVDAPAFRKQLVLAPRSAGYTRVAVVDANGQVARIDVTVK